MNCFDSREGAGVGELVDSGLLSCLVDILKTPIPDLQRKAASILEFVVANEPPSIPSPDIVSGLESAFRQKCLIEEENPNGIEVDILELEEAGLVVSAASRLLTRLLDYQQFCQSLDSDHFIKLLRSILVSSIPLQNKEWVAACLVKLSSISGCNSDPVNVEVTLYERIPRLIEDMKSSFSPQVKEAAVLELNRIISQGMVDSSRAVASSGGIFAVVELMESGSKQAVEASLAILYNLSMEAENHAAIIAAGAVPILRKIVLSERPQWIRALHLLRTLPTSYD